MALVRVGKLVLAGLPWDAEAARRTVDVHCERRGILIDGGDQYCAGVQGV
jgi:hypothetical protein